MSDVTVFLGLYFNELFLYIYQRLDVKHISGRSVDREEKLFQDVGGNIILSMCV